MKAVVEDIRSGEIQTSEVPAPELRRGGVLVRTAFSAVSSGTERAKVESSEKSLVGKAMARPDLVKQVADFARTQGIRAAYEKVKTKLDTLSTMGYSCSGTVIAVADDVSDFQIGDRVACGGAGYASHCAINWVPRNLVVRVPDSVPLDTASLTTIAAIAMQGLRQTQVSVGETVLVVGVGLLGVITMQLARAAGCRVIAIDLDQLRIDRAENLGANLAMLSSDPQLFAAIENFSRYGADAAIITAATKSAEPLELAAKVLRKRGRIVVVGDVGMGVARSSLYQKELTLAMSCSYGPGRYDPAYEEGGNDYPVGYVRWTENRNMEAVLDLMASGALQVSALLERRFPVMDAAKAYHELLESKSYTAILEYPSDEQSSRNDSRVAVSTAKARMPRSSEKLRVGCVGAGGFAQGNIFPVLRGSSLVSLESVATATGVTAESARRNYKFARSQTPAELLRDPEIDAVFIASRHESHARYVSEALRSGKAVFVEKPLAINREELESIREICRESSLNGNVPFLMVGFNRRFAPFTEQIRTFFSGRREPMMMLARINAGFIPAEHWTQQVSEGGRIVGEFCHFVDWARSMAGSSIHAVSAAALPNGSRYNRDNISVTLTFADGSIANLIYVANGDASVPKEYFEVFCEGGVARMEDFTSLELTRGRKSKKSKSTRDKGHNQELKLTLEAMALGREAPIPLEEIFEVMQATFSVAEAIGERQKVEGADELAV
jgi:predicted dehydrogenase/threonine dehydrogenase-like Zn-dependent dehydrogenase